MRQLLKRDNLRREDVLSIRNMLNIPCKEEIASIICRDEIGTDDISKVKLFYEYGKDYIDDIPDFFWKFSLGNEDNYISKQSRISLLSIAKNNKNFCLKLVKIGVVSSLFEILQSKMEFDNSFACSLLESLHDKSKYEFMAQLTEHHMIILLNLAKNDNNFFGLFVNVLNDFPDSSSELYQEALLLVNTNIFSSDLLISCLSMSSAYFLHLHGFSFCINEGDIPVIEFSPQEKEYRIYSLLLFSRIPHMPLMVSYEIILEYLRNCESMLFPIVLNTVSCRQSDFSGPQLSEMVNVLINLLDDVPCSIEEQILITLSQFHCIDYGNNIDLVFKMIDHLSPIMIISLLQIIMNLLNTSTNEAISQIFSHLGRSIDSLEELSANNDPTIAKYAQLLLQIVTNIQ